MTWFEDWRLPSDHCIRLDGNDYRCIRHDWRDRCWYVLIWGECRRYAVTG
jgi:hypothetical protein